MPAAAEIIRAMAKVTSATRSKNAGRRVAPTTRCRGASLDGREADIESLLSLRDTDNTVVGATP